MTQSDDPTDADTINRRKVLGALGGLAGVSAIGGGTSALLWDEERFGTAEVPNVLQAGKLDLKVDWEVYYYDWKSTTPQLISISDTDGDDDPDEVDDPGPIVDLTDIKPGDVIEHTLSYHVYGNPGFVSMDGTITGDADEGFTEPEDLLDGAINTSDGTDDGDLDDVIECVVWYDGDDDGDGDSEAPGNNFPEEITDYTDSDRMAFHKDLAKGRVTFDTESENFVFRGTVSELFEFLEGEPRLDPGDDVASGFSGTPCHRPSTTHYLGVLFWLPRDIPNTVDNVVQSDRLTYHFGFNAEQCRHNPPETEVACPDCSFDTTATGDGASNLLSVGPDPSTGFPDIDARVRVNSPTGEAGDLDSTNFAICEDGCGQTLESVVFESGGLVDIVVVFDDTGSMGDEIDTMQSQVTSLTNDIESAGIDARYALVSFNDEAELDQDFTDAATFQTAVNALVADGGADLPEDDLDAVAVGTGNAAGQDGAGASLSAFRSGAQRVVIDITDAPAQPEGDHTDDFTDPDDATTRFSRTDIETFLDDGNFSYYAVCPPESDTGPVSKQTIANNVDDGTWIDIDGANFDVILNDIVSAITEPAYILSYTTTNPATDGSTRTVDIQIDDPDEGLLYEEGTYTAPS